MKIYKHFIIAIIIGIFLINTVSSCFADNKYNSKSLNLTQEELEFLRTHDTFYYAIAVDYAPIEYINSEGKPKGFGVEYLKKASEILNVDFIPIEGFKNYTWEECLNGMKEGKIDLLPAVSNTEERREYISFTEPYLEMNIIVIGNNDNRLILHERDLEGTTFVFPKGYWQNEYVQSNLEDYGIINTKNMFESLKLINNMKGEYTFLESFVYNYYNNLAHFENLRIVGELKIEVSHCIGVSKGNEILRDILNKVIRNIPKDEVYENAMIVEKKENYNYIQLFLILVIILIIIIILLLRKIIVYNRYKRQMRKNKQRLIENLSHDLKTPLSILKVNIALLKNGILNKNEIKNHLVVLDNSVDSLNFIIEDLYAITHIKDSLIERNFVLTNVSQFLRQIYNQYIDVFNEKNKNLIFNEDDVNKSVNINIDRNSMYRAISNLLLNAHKYTDEFDVVILEYRVENNKVVIIINDNGQGIDKHSLEHIFDRFYQGERQSNISGKGLGLSITKEIIEMHDGQISVVSKKKNYTSFTIKLPIGKTKENN